MLFSVISFMFALCFSNIIYSFRKSNVSSDGLSKTHVNLYLENSTEEINELKTINTLKENSKLLYKIDNVNNGKGVYFTEDNFKPNIIWGRNFNENDFISKNNTILINEDLVDRCTKKNGKLIYFYEGREYEVIGAYIKSNNKVNEDANFYYNLLANTTTIQGNYLIETDNLEELINSIGKLTRFRLNDNMVQNNFKDRVLKAVSAEALSINTIGLLFLMIILNVINLSINWLIKRIRELSIRRLCGASNKQIRLLVIKDFLIILTISFILGYSVFVMSVTFNILKGVEVSILAFLISFLAILFIVFIMNIIITRYYDKESIAKRV